VEAGQAIARLVFDEDGVAEQLANLDTELIRLEMSVEATENKIARVQESIAALLAEEYTANEATDKDVRTAENRLDAQKKTVAEKEILYNTGDLTRKDYDAALAELAALEEALAEAKAAYDKSLTQAATDLEKKDKDRAAQVQNWQIEIEGYRQELRGKELDRTANRLKREKLELELESFDNSRTLCAETDGTVISLNLQRGRTVNADELIATFGLNGTYLLECDIPVENNFVAVGDNCTISNTNHSYQAQVARLTVADGKKRVTLFLTQKDIQVGETFDLSFRKDSADSHSLVPNAALYEDSNGHYIYILRERKGILGQEYFVQKQDVQIGDSDGTNTIVLRGGSIFDPIVTLSDKPFDDNAAVKLRNEGDFIVQ